MVKRTSTEGIVVKYSEKRSHDIQASYSAIWPGPPVRIPKSRKSRKVAKPEPGFWASNIIGHKVID
jgi:hypothetical protein